MLAKLLSQGSFGGDEHFCFTVRASLGKHSARPARVPSGGALQSTANALPLTTRIVTRWIAYSSLAQRSASASDARDTAPRERLAKVLAPRIFCARSKIVKLTFKKRQGCFCIKCSHCLWSNSFTHCNSASCCFASRALARSRSLPLPLPTRNYRQSAVTKPLAHAVIASVRSILAAHMPSMLATISNYLAAVFNVHNEPASPLVIPATTVFITRTWHSGTSYKYESCVLPDPASTPRRLGSARQNRQSPTPARLATASSCRHAAVGWTPCRWGRDHAPRPPSGRASAAPS